jgi:hypothetical protein
MFGCIPGAQFRLCYLSDMMDPFSVGKRSSCSCRCFLSFSIRLRIKQRTWYTAALGRRPLSAHGICYDDLRRDALFFIFHHHYTPYPIQYS